MFAVNELENSSLRRRNRRGCIRHPTVKDNDFHNGMKISKMNTGSFGHSDLIKLDK